MIIICWSLIDFYPYNEVDISWIISMIFWSIWIGINYISEEYFLLQFFIRFLIWLGFALIIFDRKISLDIKSKIGNLILLIVFIVESIGLFLNWLLCLWDSGSSGHWF